MFYNNNITEFMKSRSPVDGSGKSVRSPPAERVDEVEDDVINGRAQAVVVGVVLGKGEIYYSSTLLL